MILTEKTDIKVALAGNPNVGKSTVFNALTGLHQHTGNWSGKTVTTAKGEFSSGDCRFELIDLPGTYSLYAHSDEERAARDYICFAKTDRIVVVADAGALERNLNLALSILECRGNVTLVVNLCDEAKKNGIKVDQKTLSDALGIPVILASARDRKGIPELVHSLESTREKSVYEIAYPKAESAIELVASELAEIGKCDRLPVHWVAVKLLEAEEVLCESIRDYCGFDIGENERLDSVLARANEVLAVRGIEPLHFSDYVAACIASTAQTVANAAVIRSQGRKKSRLTARLDRILIGKYTAFPILLLMLGGLLWISAVGANYPSAWLSSFFTWGGENLAWLMRDLPWWIRSPLLDGVYLVVTWVIAVMLPPMAIFFPLFTLAEDFGILPRVALDLDRAFSCAGTCGKQSLTM